MSRVIPLGGRFFAPAEQTTVRQDGWTMAQVEDAGLLDLLSDSTVSDEARARKLIVRAMRSGLYCGIAAGLLVEIDKKWSVAEAEKNAEAFAELTSAEDKAALLDAFSESLTRFFTSGLFRSTPSRTASTRDGKGQTDAPSIDESEGSGQTPSDGSPTATATD